MKVLITIVPAGGSYSIPKQEVIAKLKGDFDVVAEEAAINNEFFNFVTTKDEATHEKLLTALKDYDVNFNPLAVDAYIKRRGFQVIHVNADYQQISEFFNSINADITYYDEGVE